MLNKCTSRFGHVPSPIHEWCQLVAEASAALTSLFPLLIIHRGLNKRNTKAEVKNGIKSIPSNPFIVRNVYPGVGRHPPLVGFFFLVRLDQASPLLRCYRLVLQRDFPSCAELLPSSLTPFALTPNHQCSSPASHLPQIVWASQVPMDCRWKTLVLA